MSALHWLPVLTTTGLVVNGMRLRDRLSGLRRVRPADPREAAGEYALVAATGVELSPQVQSAAVEFARRNHLQVLDLVPVDLPVGRALDFARSVDTRTYTTEPAVPGSGAGHATVVTHGVLERAGIAAGAYDSGDYGALTVRLKQYAKGAGMAVIPGPAGRSGSRRAWLRGLGQTLPLAAATQLGAWGLVVFCLLACPVAGLISLVAYCSVPYLVFAVGPLAPRDLHRAALLRPLAVPLSWLRLLLAPRTDWELGCAERIQEAHAYYRAELAKGVERFLEPRRADCPWCGSHDLSVHLRGRDLVQCKPGRFTLDRCGDCRHIFQNPRLTPEGAEFYFRDVYDGLGLAAADRVLSGQARWYRARAETVRAVTRPRTWLDVGTGHAHFCRSAAAVLPDTAFDGLDASDRIDEAVQRGWIRRGHKGRFTDLVDELAGRYDVISMHHYLEHARDPFAELDAATKVLAPGGHLLVEMPDPESVFARLLRGYWIPWLPPHHQHLIPIENLKRALTARGMEIVTEVRRGAQQGPDLPGAALVMLNALGPQPGRPWAPRDPSVLDYARRVGVLVLAGPVLLAAYALHSITWPFVRAHGNAYRVLARKEVG